MQSIDSTETYIHGRSEDVMHVKEKIKRCNIIKISLTLTLPQEKA